MLRTWIEPHSEPVPEEFSQAIGGNALVSRILFSRGISDINTARGFLSAGEYHSTSGSELPSLDKAVEIIMGAIASKKRIGVWGDFDVDGQTSTTVLVSAIKELGGNVGYHIPVRAEESHGITLPALEKFLDQGVELIVTCDTGITAVEAVNYANGRAIPVIITDHHDLPAQLPSAGVIVNPKTLPDGHPLSKLPGVGVAYKIIEELLYRAGEGRSAEQYLDLVALGIVADIALLKGDTRYLLQRGLQVLRNTTRKGLLAMMELTELNPSNITEEHIGYILAPRLNAIGRLADANSMVELLTTNDMGRARVLALELEGMNARRKLLTDQVYQAALSQLQADPKLLEEPLIFLSHPSWPAGVIGVVASRLVDQYHRPVILLSVPPGNPARGSARSVEGINITAAITENKALLIGFGGHPMAAGLAIDSQRIPEFQHAISQTVQAAGIRIQKEKDLQIDGYLTLTDLSLDLVEDFERLAPFGAGNPPLVFATRDLKLTGYAAVGRTAEHLQLTIEDELGHTQSSIWWQGAGFMLPEVKFDLAYTVRASSYRGLKDVQIEWIDYRLCEEDKITFVEKQPLVVIDFRKDPDPLTRLKVLQAQEELIVWGESDTRMNLSCLDRFSLVPSAALAIWTIPPGPEEIRFSLNKVDPSQVYLFALNPGMDAPDAFLQRLVGLVKHCLKNFDGLARITSLAAATSQRLLTVKAGLEWLDARGHIKLVEVNGDDIHMVSGDGTSKSNLDQTTARLNSLLAESAAFRRYYLIANKDHLLANPGK